jgi:hypothetical protein
MSDHATGANACGSRRRFLRAGAGLAGVLSASAVLAACGAPAAQAPSAEQTAPAPTTPVNAYLIAAYYDHAKWKGLNDQEGKLAEEQAERLFPDEQPKSLPQLNPPDGDRLPQLTGVSMVRTFRSAVFDKLPQQYLTMSRQDKNAVLDTFLGPQATKTDIGWMAVVDTDHFSSFLKQVCGETCLFWRMYDIEVLPLHAGWTMADVSTKVPPLNDDRTTEDIYKNMTVRSWNQPAP